MKYFNWPTQAIPDILKAAEFAHSPSEYYPIYNMDFNAIHLYHYACTMRLGELEFDIEPGDITITPAHIPSSYLVTKGNCHHICAHFKQAPATVSGDSVKIPLLIKSKSNINSGLLERFKLLITTQQQIQFSVSARFAANAMLHHILLYLATLDTIPQENQSTLQRVANYLERNCTEQLSIAEIVEYSGLSQNYLASQFKKYYGKTLQEYILECRIDLAKYYLATTNMQVKEIGYQVGIPDSQYFNRLFKKATGMTPLEYRNR